MAKPKTMDEYLAKVQEEQKILLEKLRKQVKAAAPEAIERLNWGMPGFTYKGKMLVSFAAFKGHCSFFPMREMAGKDRLLLKGYETTKGSIHFTKEKPLKALLVKKIVKMRMKEITKA